MKLAATPPTPANPPTDVPSSSPTSDHTNVGGGPQPYQLLVGAVQSPTDATVSVLSDALKESAVAPGGDEEEQLAWLEKKIADMVLRCVPRLKDSLRSALLFSVLSAEFIICDIIIRHWLGPTNLANTLEQDATPSGTDPLAPISNIPASAFRARAICYASLVLTSHVAFITVFGKQWILDYTRVTLSGDIVDRVKERQVKLIGLKKWGFRLVTTSSFMAGFVPILFWTALTVYVWDLNDYFLRAMTMIVLAATVATVGNTFYMDVVAVA